MFIVYYSNLPETLQSITAAIMNSNPLRDPFQPEVILVQNPVMGHWMQLELAAKFGVAANIDFNMPSQFIWQMFTRVLPDIPESNVFSKLDITWKLMTILPEVNNVPGYEVISQSLQENDKIKCFQLARSIADIYNRYLIYRPDWLNNWEMGESLDKLRTPYRWQAILWRELILYTLKLNQSSCNYANLYQRFIQTLKQSSTRNYRLPARIFIYGISSLPPTYLEVLHALGQHIDIHLLFNNPCRYYWGDINDHTFSSYQINSKRYRDQHHMEFLNLFRTPGMTDDISNTEYGEHQFGNPLLASWGKIGRDYLYMLSQLEGVEEIDAFITPRTDNVLGLLQNDILEMENHVVLGGVNTASFDSSCSKRPLDPEDRSISIHVCHSLQREVEVLYDSILSMLSNDPDLSPREMIVMAPDINLYIPAIITVFGGAAEDRYLPYTICDRSLLHINQILPAFITLLELPHIQLIPEHLLSLLAVPALAAQFTIKEKELKILQRFLTRLGKWYVLDDNNLRELMMMHNKSSSMIAESIGKLIKLIIQLRLWHDHLSIPRTLSEWRSCASDIIKDFFYSNIEEVEAALTILEHHWQHILKSGLDASCTQHIPVEVLREQLITILNQDHLIHHFFNGTLNFCKLIPVRPITFKVVCLLGMNDNEYPPSIPVPGFDLMSHHQMRRGDFSNHDEYRYLFLEILMSAQKLLYISFIGRNMYDDNDQYPSILVSELTKYIANSFYLPKDKMIDTETSASRLISHLWQWHSRMPFAQENFIPGNTLQSFSDEWLSVAKANNLGYTSFVQILSTIKINNISLERLKNFYNHPVRAWFQQRLLVSFPQKNIKSLSDKRSTIDHLTRYKINYKLLDAMIHEEDTYEIHRQLQNDGILPNGVFGEIFWNTQYKKMKILSKIIRLSYHKSANYSIKINLTLNDIKFTGLLQVQDSGILRWRPGNLSIKDGIMLWLDHLTYCAIGGTKSSRMIGVRGEWHFHPVPTDHARSFLLKFISGYCNGMSSPLLLLYRSGGAWLTHCLDRQTNSINWNDDCQRQALYKLREAWTGDNYVPGDISDPYLYRLVCNLDDNSIKAIMQASENYLLPLFLFNKNRGNR